jgi:protoporphyrinogen oxidase
LTPRDGAAIIARLNRLRSFDPADSYGGGPPLEGKRVIVLGGGLSGLSAAHWLCREGVPVTVLERGLDVGGLARTVERHGFRFDLGGYRFIGNSTEVQKLLAELLGQDLLEVTATSKIYYRGKLYAYPLEAHDLLKKLGVNEAALALWSYAGNRLARGFPRRFARNLEEWLLGEFGETLYRAFFRDYNEKIWGLPCHRLSAELASRRIRGFRLLRSLFGGLVPAALDRTGERRFLYPRRGIGQLSDALAQAIGQRAGQVVREATATEIVVKRARVETVSYRDGRGEAHALEGTNLISSIPLPRLIYLVNPRPPADVLASARSLQFRDIISVCLEIQRDRVTRDSWIYVPDPAIGFARVLEPKNWSDAMCAPGRTSLVAEYYCFEGDRTWARSDEELVQQTIDDLATRLELIDRSEVIGGFALRIRKPYPIYELGYHEHLARIHDYLRRIVNLQAIGRGGLFKYYNVGHLVRSGIRAAENVFGAGHDLWGVNADDLPQKGLFKDTTA